MQWCGDETVSIGRPRPSCRPLSRFVRGQPVRLGKLRRRGERTVISAPQRITSFRGRPYQHNKQRETSSRFLRAGHWQPAPIRTPPPHHTGSSPGTLQHPHPLPSPVGLTGQHHQVRGPIPSTGRISRKPRPRGADRASTACVRASHRPDACGALPLRQLADLCLTRTTSHPRAVYTPSTATEIVSRSLHRQRSTRFEASVTMRSRLAAMAALLLAGASLFGEGFLLLKIYEQTEAPDPAAAAQRSPSPSSHPPRPVTIAAPHPAPSLLSYSRRRACRQNAAAGGDGGRYRRGGGRPDHDGRLLRRLDLAPRLLRRAQEVLCRRLGQRRQVQQSRLQGRR